jgi:hypothetical protein
MTHAAPRAFAFIAVIGLATVAAFGVDPPDLEINSLTGLVETVDATWSGTNFNIRYSIMNGAGSLASSVLLSSNSANDLDPRIAINPSGNAYVVWWRDTPTDKILFRKRTLATGLWAGEQTVGMPSESNARPRIAIAGGSPWVAYQIQGARSRSIGAQIIADGPEPFRIILATTSFGGDLDIQIHSVSGHLWVTWVDTSQRVGYAQYDFDKQFWLPTGYESFASDSIANARSRIQNLILNL